MFCLLFLIDHCQGWKKAMVLFLLSPYPQLINCTLPKLSSLIKVQNFETKQNASNINKTPTCMVINRELALIVFFLIQNTRGNYWGREFLRLSWMLTRATFETAFRISFSASSAALMASLQSTQINNCQMVCKSKPSGLQVKSFTELSWLMASQLRFGARSCYATSGVSLVLSSFSAYMWKQIPFNGLT